MAITINNQHIKSNKNLSIQISLNGLSFCILNTESKTVVFLKEISTEKRETPFTILEMLITAFKTEKELQTSFNNIQIIHENELATLVPDVLFQEENLADYLKFNSKILRSDFIGFDKIDINKSVNVYVPYVNINNYIYEKFGTFSYKHFSTILIESILKKEKGETFTKMYAHIQSTHFEIIVVKNGELLLYNSFEYTTKEDFIYYVLFTAEHLKLNPDELILQFLGKVSESDDLYNIAYKYIRHIRFAQRRDTFKFQEKPESNHAFFTLIHSL
ncbi:DUF3822 family protein [Bizionia argentinensis JUB59]|uniref:DUF3822 family protein n=1 Tax=Bizionia argentinensis JUB59 TaxID=1046627 RepID=G2EHP2_9FLAO|nr:DUF3822 family protein [Bizionia argentinensis]EGV42032.2 DUF3822 family protein [Bizionia argentinensis JUB59]